MHEAGSAARDGELICDLELVARGELCGLREWAWEHSRMNLGRRSVSMGGGASGNIRTRMHPLRNYAFPSSFSQIIATLLS